MFYCITTTQRYAVEHLAVSRGRPKKLSERDEKLITRYVSTGVVETASEAAREISRFFPIHISRQTAARALRKWGCQV